MNEAQSNALKYTLTAGLLSALGGGGLAYMANKMQKTDPESLEDLNTTSPDLVEIPYPIVKKKKPQGALPAPKIASLKGFLGGENAESWHEVPWAPAAMVGGTALGGLGAYKLIDSLMKKKRKEGMKDQLADAEEEYKKTLLNSYDPKRLQLIKSSKAQEINEGLEKLASMLKISEEEENLFDKMVAGNAPPPSAAEKTYAATSSGLKTLGRNLGMFPNVKDAPGWMGVPTGLAMLAAGTIPIASGYAAYKYFKKRNKSNLVNEAAKARALERMGENVPAPYAAIED
jgi:hypothetical protein